MTGRSLILAGGGLKIAYQAGVLQVWLDEAGIEFDHADGVSAATFNLAMWCQGMSGLEIADNWRGFQPLQAKAVKRAKPSPAAVRSVPADLREDPPQRLPAVGPGLGGHPCDFPPGQFQRPQLHGAATGGLSACSDERGSPGRLRVVAYLVPAGCRGRTGLRRRRARLEEATNSRLRAALADIERSNARLARGEDGSYGRHIRVRMLEAEVPLHYLLNFRHRRFAEAVEMGVRDARTWCSFERLP